MNALRRIRKQHKLTQKQLASIAKVSHQLISKHEQDHISGWHVEYLHRIAKALMVLPSEIFNVDKGFDSSITLAQSNHITRGSDFVQVKNPRTGKYVKIDKTLGKIVGHRKKNGPYKKIPCVPS